MTDAAVVATSTLDSLVGDGKKYRTVEDLAASRVNADTHIERIENENKTLRSELTVAIREIDTIKNKISILDRLNTNQNPDDTQGTVVARTPEPQVKGITEEDVLKVVERRDVERQADKNKQEVDNVLAKQFGNEARGFLVQKAGELGVNVNELVATALKSPRAFFNMVGIDPNPRTSGTTYVGNRNTVTNSSEPVRNNAFYDKLKNEMGVRKFILDTKLQKQRYQDMERLGDAWDAS